MGFYIENTKGWYEKIYFGIGRSYDDLGDLDVIFVDFIIWRIGWWFK